MDIQELKYVLALAEYQNFTVAAEACSLSQSSLSKHLLKIEEEIGNISLLIVETTCFADHRRRRICSICTPHYRRIRNTFAFDGKI